VLSGFINAAKLSCAASGLPLSSHRILFFGAGSAGVGVGTQLTSFFTLHGLSEQEARERIWLIDSQGLVYDSRGRLAEHKKCMLSNFLLSHAMVELTTRKDFSRKDYEGPPITNILDIIDYVKPTALLGLSTIHVRLQRHLFSIDSQHLHWVQGAFTPAVIQAMAVLNPRPIIFPLSNPSKLSECSFQEAVENTDGQVLFASGSPFPPMEYGGTTLYPGQGNNMYIFPGLYTR
jgi:malate dehydrogenase (oxaloacetate-decarboxylating)(NADP+)